MSNFYIKERFLNMKQEKETECIVFECMKNICNYYSKDIEIIEEFKKTKQED